MYNLQDKTYRNQPLRMCLETTEMMAKRIRSHLRVHNRTNAEMILHGGEPLLLGISAMKEWLDCVRNVFGEEIIPRFNIQSNGVLINDEWIEFLANEGVRIGISLDGPRWIHDKHRLTHGGKGSYDAVLRSIDLLRAHPRGDDIFSTVMGVVDLDLDPDEYWTHFKSLGVFGLDISLPHANYAHPPREGKWSYRDWLIRLFDLWFYDSDSHGFRYFENIIRTVCEYPLSSDNIGGKPVGVLVIETNGDYEGTDALKSTIEGMTKLDKNVFDNDIDELFQIPIVSFLQQLEAPVCDTCRSCKAYDACGGGYLPHRFSTDTIGDIQQGFINPSIYCDALFGLVQHAYSTLRLYLGSAA